jgi:predicted transposase YdaD
MQQRQGPRPFDITTRLLIDSDPAGWLRWVGLPVDGPVQPVDSEMSTVLAEVDKVLRVGAPSPWLAHLELQSSYDRLLPIRLLQYHGLLLRKHELPVESTVVLLRQQADGPALTGRYEQRGPRGRVTVAFAYEVVRVWQRPVQELLTGGLGLVPLAPLADLGSVPLPEVLAQMDERIEEDVPPTAVGEFWANARILMGLRYDRDVVDQVFRRVREMRESVTYQEILEEGREEGIEIGRRQGLAAGLEEGREEGRLDGERRILLRLATSRFGEPSADVRAHIDRISDLGELERLGLRVLTATSWDDLLLGTGA